MHEFSEGEEQKQLLQRLPANYRDGAKIVALAIVFNTLVRQMLDLYGEETAKAVAAAAETAMPVVIDGGIDEVAGVIAHAENAALTSLRQGRWSVQTSPNGLAVDHLLGLLGEAPKNDEEWAAAQAPLAEVASYLGGVRAEIMSRLRFAIRYMNSPPTDEDTLAERYAEDGAWDRVAEGAGYLEDWIGFKAGR
jgi:hypothetical protein